MRAATITGWSKPLEILTVERPRPGPRHILVKVTASSLCMSDVFAWKGFAPATLPYCGGHERAYPVKKIQLLLLNNRVAVGVVEEVGSGVVGFKPGDRVGFMPPFETCRTLSLGAFLRPISRTDGCSCPRNM